MLRLHSPFTQNIISGLCVAFTAGIYVALNILGAGGGRPDSQAVTSIVNSCLCACWVVTSFVSSIIMQYLGPGITTSLGVLGYAVYVGSLWYFDQVGGRAFPIFAGCLNGIGAGFLFVVSGYIQLCYPEENEKGKYVVTAMGLQAFGSIVGSSIALGIDVKDTGSSAGVPAAVYITFIVLMMLMSLLGLLLVSPSKVRRDDGSPLIEVEPMKFKEAVKANIDAVKDWKLLLMFPAFFPAEAFLVYSGSANAFHNNLRTRCLLGFVALVIQVPCGFALQALLDHKTWRRRSRAFAGLVFVGTPLMAAWIWEIIRVRGYDRHNPPKVTMDWTDDGFAPICVLFIMNWVASSLWQYLVVYWLGALSNDPLKAANYSGIWRGVLAAGEAIIFGADSTLIPFEREAGVLFALYATGILIFAYLAYFHIQDTLYFTEDRVVVPNHIIEEIGEEKAT
ncbi:hypothetical protein N7510_006372 [Penicillium lagena]|uniref:uncharacterized protein n=1 Tax=Penicillium lagena TaxID=94218 RepID=UPI002540FFB5|nr:uncharacterized protein N7510_006372 [Penicillium lagena]KAJ5613178.1 hypothetical protein N7510_006372 [Penicillium lagena]